ncbi:MAG: SecDF P1 head subdomain-containing protein, partial [Nocardioides sp.]
MARKPRPGRSLLVFLAFMGLVFGLVALAGSWKPELGLDLQGGTRITLQTKGEVKEASLKEAASIIDQRVNGSGVTEAEVTTQGTNIIVVEIPGKTRRDLEETVRRQAQMRFRLVARTGPGVAASDGAGDPTQQGDQAPGEGVLAPTEKPSTGSSEQPSGEKSATPNPRPALDLPEAAPSDDPSDQPSGTSSPEPSKKPSDSSASPAEGDQSQAPPADNEPAPVDKPIEWAKNPDAASVAAYDKFACPEDNQRPEVDDDPAKPLVTCDESGQKYLLSAAAIEGTDLRRASAGIPQNSTAWAVFLTFKGEAVDIFADISRDLINTERQFAIVLDGLVISAPGMEGVITDGSAQITGNFTQTEAQSLATSLKFGALPVAFSDDINVQTIGATLAGDQLRAGLIAGGLGLALVLIYCMFYYRGLGLVVLASLGIAALLTYALVLLLSKTAGFTLSLPGIAGLIVAVGIT